MTSYQIAVPEFNLVTGEAEIKESRSLVRGKIRLAGRIHCKLKVKVNASNRGIDVGYSGPLVTQRLITAWLKYILGPFKGPSGKLMAKGTAERATVHSFA